MAKTKGQLEVAKWEAYKAAGGKLGFWEWRNAGMPTRDFGIPGKDPIWKWNWTPPSLKTTIPTVTSSTTPQWGSLTGQGFPTSQTSGWEWTSPEGQGTLPGRQGILPTGGKFNTSAITPPITTPSNGAPAGTPTGATPDTGTLTFTGMYPDRNGNPTVLRRSDGKYFYPDGLTEMSTEDVYNFYNIALKAASEINAPVSDPNAITPYQQWTIDRQTRLDEQAEREAQAERDRQQAEAKNKEWMLQYDIQKQASESAIQKQQNEMELIKGRSFPFPYEQGNRQAYQQMQAGAFESARQSILGSLTSPADWIKRWEVQNAANPYTMQPQSRLEEKQGELTNTETRANMFDQMANESEKLASQLETNPDYGAGTPNEATVLTQARNDAVMYRNAAKTERDKIGVYQTDVTYLQGQPQPLPSQPGRPGNAPAPSWLPMFAPGQRAGQAISRENVATPSAQQWTSTPWSVQQGLSGYLDWAGYRPMADILGNMAQMLPNAPGGGSRWSPYIGR